MLTVLQKQHEQKVSARSFLQQLLQRSLRLAISSCWPLVFAGHLSRLTDGEQPFISSCFIDL